MYSAFLYSCYRKSHHIINVMIISLGTKHVGSKNIIQDEIDVPLSSGDNIEFVCLGELVVLMAFLGGLPLGLGTKSTGEVAVGLGENEIVAGVRGRDKSNNMNKIIQCTV